MADDDSMWRHGADETHAPAIAFDSFTVSDMAGDVQQIELADEGFVPDEPRRQSGRARWLLGFAAVLAVGVAAVVFAARINADDRPERPDFAAVAGADNRRLPAEIDRLWSTTIDASNFLSRSAPPIIVDGRAALISLLDAPDAISSTGIAFDPITGRELWRRPFEFTSASANLLGVLDGTLVVERNDLDERQLIGIEVTSGEITWSLPTRDNGVHVILSGTNVVTRVSFTGNPRLTFVDPATGAEVARAPGRLIGTDLSGTWYIINGRRVAAIDLSETYTEPVEVVTGVEIGERPIGVVDGRVIVIDDDGTLAEVEADATDADDAFVPLVALGADLPDLVSLIATGGRTFMAIGDGKVIGATLDGTDVEIRWEYDGSVRVVDVSTRGLLVAIRDRPEPGAAEPSRLRVVDAVTGESLATSASGQRELLPQLLGDGFVTANDDGLGVELIGYDVDGNEQWRLANNTPIAIGDRIVATSSVGPDGYTFTVFGDPG